MYVTLEEFRSSPLHAIDTSMLVPGGTTVQNDAALTTMIESAMTLVNERCGVETFERQTGIVETERLNLDRYGDFTIRPRSHPISAVTSVSYRTHPAQAWVAFDTSYVEIDRYGRSFSVRSNPIPSIGGVPLGNYGVWSAYGGYNSYLDPQSLERLRRIPFTVQYTYDVGYTVDTMPTAIKSATILYAANLIKERGANAVTMSGTPSTMGGSPYDNNDIELAKSLLRPWKRVI